jgi:hypothetical protein
MTRPSICRRVAFVTLALGLLFAGLALAEEGPSADLFATRHCAPVTPAPSAGLSPAIAKPVTPRYKACFWAIYDEFYKNGELCRYGDTCSRQYFGTCPNGWDYHYTETIQCCR